MDGQRLAILCGGGPAPGLNSVIGAAAIRARLAGVEVLGLQEGFRWLMAGDAQHARPLEIDAISRIHFAGGSIIGVSRANPTTSPALLETTLRTLQELGVDKLITIGGDDTAYSAMKLAQHARGRLRVAHVPKTIDNDLDLPHGIVTFGYQTARHVGVEIVKNLMVDARTSNHWYLVVAMGRQAGHLALGMGKAASATLTLIPEELAGQRVPLSHLVDLLAGAVVKRHSMGKDYGVAILAEGLVERLAPEELTQLGVVEHDEHGHLRLAEFNLADTLKGHLRQRIAPFGIPTTLVSKDIGYELRCADPIPYDMEYTRDLGYCAAQLLLEGGNEALVTLQEGHFVSIPFSQLLDPVTGRMRVRVVDVASEHYLIALRYMVRLRSDDFTDPARLAELAAAARLSAPAFRQQFAYVATAQEAAPPPV